MIAEIFIYIILILSMFDIVSTWMCVRIAKTTDVEINQFMRWLMKHGYEWSVLVSFIGIGLLVYIFKFSPLLFEIIYTAFLLKLADNNLKYIRAYNKYNRR